MEELPSTENGEAALRVARQRYEAYDTQVWTHAYFDEATGGFNVYHNKHQFSDKGRGGDGEKEVGKVLAKLGKRVEFLQEGGKTSADLSFDGKTWDVKTISTNNDNRIRGRLQKGAKQGDNIIFYWFDDEGDKKLTALRSAIQREVGDRKRRGAEMPDVYYIGDGLLKALFKK